jgi:hypothetical protein
MQAKLRAHVSTTGSPRGSSFDLDGSGSDDSDSLSDLSGSSSEESIGSSGWSDSLVNSEGL